METKSKGESYSGPSGGIKKPSDWLASEDLPLGKDVVVQVEDVRMHKNVKFDKGRTEAKLGSLKFKGKDKEMILNATNRKTMVRMFTTDTRKWREVYITLYIDPKCRNPEGGAPVPGLRIRFEESQPKPETKTAAEQTAAGQP